MSSPLPPDPYLALGLTKDATATQVKSTYRKLVLKCHPDKVTDPLLKPNAVDEFHRIQQAYEILSDEDRRKRYDAQVQLADLRRHVMDKQKNPSHQSFDVKSPQPTHKTPTSAPVPAFPTQASDRLYEERKPNKVYDSEDEYFPNSRSTRKHDDYDSSAKKSLPRDEKIRPKPSERSQKEAEKATRADRRKMKDRETRKERATKFRHVDDDSASDDLRRRPRYDSDRQRNDFRERLQREEAPRDRERDFSQRERERELRDNDLYAARPKKGREQPTASDYDERMRRDSSRVEDVRNYIGRTVREPARPPAGIRSTSMRESYSVDRSRDGPPVIMRRASARPLARDLSPPRMPSRYEGNPKYTIPETREYYTPEIYAEPEPERRSERRASNIQTSNSSPAAFRPNVRASPIRSQSLQPEYDDLPHPHILRSETMPDIGRRRRDASQPLKSSQSRETDFVDGLPTPSTTPEFGEYAHSPLPIPPTTRYRYAPNDIFEEDLSGHRFSRGDRYFTRSPSPILQTRPSAPRYVSSSGLPPLRTSQQYRASSPVESPLPRRSPDRPSLGRRESSKTTPLYAEIPAENVRYVKRPAPVPRTSSTRKSFMKNQSAAYQ